ncbi:MAG: ribonuclease J [Clostridiales bacterium]|nr:ribonuclease J [Clostridiales bacterium]
MTEKLKIIPLGGLNEIGKNMTVVEYGGDIIVIDCGLAFPDEEMLGIDLVIPDVTYLKKHKSRVRGIILTHGHEDHIGAIPYVLKEINIPIYCTKLTAGIIESRLQEHKMVDKVKINRRGPGDHFKLGCFDIEFISVNHSIADAVALAITTPMGVVLHTGDFKIDATPVAGEMIDLARFGELGKQGVLLLMSDSTNAERRGHTMSEKSVGEAFDLQFKNCDQRILIATFASNVHRLQQIIDVAAKYGRKVAISGRSMENILNVAMNLEYVTVPKGTLIDLAAINRYPKNKLCIITTGSQGEPMSALHRMAFSGHKQVEVGAGDRILIAASPIPGNEKSVYRLINELMKKGAEVVYERLAEIHVSGHACQEELKTILALVKPKYFMPVHGEFRHLKNHAELGRQTGVESKNIFIGETGRILEITKQTAKLAGTVQTGCVLIDGLGVGDVGNAVLRDRRHLAEDGLIIITVTLDGTSGLVLAGPDIVSRGFIYVREAEPLMEEIKKIAVKTLDKCEKEKIKDWATMKTMIKDDLSIYLYKKTKRSPLILPIIMEI